MTAQNICRYFKFGFCKYLVKCRFQHIKEICENKDCNVKSCSLRHPKICSFYREYNRCKFGEWCLFKHVDENKNSDEEILSKIENLEKLIEQKDSLISILVEKVKFIEEKLAIHEATEDSTENLSDDKQIRKETVEIFKCNFCNFESNSKKDVQIHIKKKHGKKFECDQCEKVFESETEKNLHRKTHSFKSRFINTKREDHVCENCDFICKSIYTMEVHIGKCYSNNFECGFCDAKFEDIDSLELHLRTCEMYECSECYLKLKDLSEKTCHRRS